MGTTASSAASHAPTSSSRSGSTDIPSDNPSVSLNDTDTGSGRRQQRSTENCTGSGSGNNSGTGSNKLGEESVLLPHGGGGHITSSCEDSSVGESSSLVHTEVTAASLTNSASSCSSTMRLLDPLLHLLGPLASRFLLSQGITTVDAFLASETREIALALLERRKRENLKKRAYNTVMYEVKNWKRDVQQRQATRKEKPVDLHIAFEVLNPTVRSFLAAQSIATPSDLRLVTGAALARSFNNWRTQQGMINLKFCTSEKCVSLWRESVERQGVGLAGTVAAVSPRAELLGDSVVSHDDAAEATPPYKVNSETLGTMTAHISPAEKSVVAFDARVVPVGPSQKSHSATDTHVHESGVEKQPTRMEKAANALSLVDPPVKTCTHIITVADCADPQALALAVAVASTNVQESDNDTMKMNATARSALEFDSSGKGHAFEKTIGVATVIQPTEAATENKLTKDATTAKAIGGYGVGVGGGSTGLRDTQAPAPSHEVTESGQSAESIQLDTSLYLLGPLASRFLLSEGITTVDAFLASETREMALALLARRKRENLEKRMYRTVMNEVNNWKREVQQRQATRKEKPVDLHIAFEVLNPTVRSFLAAQSIASPSDLRLTSGAALARSFNTWRTQQGMMNLKFCTSEKYVSMWRESVERQSMGLAGTAAAIHSLPEPQECDNDTMKMKVAADSALTFDSLDMGRATENTAAIPATYIQPSDVLIEIATVTSRKETIGNLGSRAPIETTVDSASADGQEQGLDNGIIPDSQRKRAQDESTETRRVEPSRKKLRYTVFWV